MPLIQNITLEVAGFTLPALLRPASANTNRPLLFCIHGGSYTAHYFNYATQPDTNLFAIAGALDYPIIAITRPGYEKTGANSPSYADQAAILSAAITLARQTHAPNAPISIVGHSIGALLAMMIATDHAPEGLMSLDLSGIGMRYHDHARRGFSKFLAMDNPPLEPNADARQRRMFGPEATYDPAVLTEDIANAPMTRMGDMAGLLQMEEDIHHLAQKITHPVHLSIGEHDALWQTHAEDIASARTAFTRAPLARFRVQPNAGHCLHLHKNARATHLHTLAFVEDVVDAARQKD